MAEPLFDPSIYLGMPSMSLAALTVLAKTLVLAAPRDLPALPKRALAKMAKLGQSSQAAQIDRQRVSGLRYEDRRAVDVRADRAVSFIQKRLEQYALLTVDEFPKAPRAAELNELLFPEGLGFISLPFVEQLAAMEVLVARIDEEELVADLTLMCGADLVKNLRRSLAIYRDMVQGGLQKVDDSENLQDYRHKLGAAIVNYATKVAALYEEEDPHSLTRVQAALQPIQTMRAQLIQRPSDEPSAPEVPTTSEVPPADAAATT